MFHVLKINAHKYRHRDIHDTFPYSIRNGYIGFVQFVVAQFIKDSGFAKNNLKLFSQSLQLCTDSWTCAYADRSGVCGRGALASLANGWEIKSTWDLRHLKKL